MPKALHTEPYRKFRKLLVDARKKAGLTQTALANQLGKRQSYVAKYENGERRLDVLEFLAISAAIGCDPTRIIKQLQKP